MHACVLSEGGAWLLQAVRECGALREHARTLSMNLESHARVVENLISLNSELMDAANLRALGESPCMPYMCSPKRPAASLYRQKPLQSKVNLIDACQSLCACMQPCASSKYSEWHVCCIARSGHCCKDWYINKHRTWQCVEESQSLA